MTLLKEGITLGKAKVIVDIVRKGNKEIRPAKAMEPTEACIHNTGNSGRGANAKAHNTYIHNMSKLPESATGYASWHLSVDEKFIYQHLPLNETAWHTGDGSGAKSGNMNAIGIEICENSDMTPAQYKQAEENAIALTVHLMKMFGITASKVKPHQDYSGKYCPRVILKRDGSFSKFRARIVSAYGNNVTPKPPVSKPVVSKPKVDKLPSNVYGTVLIVSPELNMRQEADFKSKVVAKLKKGKSFKCYGIKNGLYNLGSGYVSSGSAYVKFTGNPDYVNSKNPPVTASKPTVGAKVQFGTVKVLVVDLKMRRDATTSSDVVKLLEINKSFKCYGIKNGFYDLGSGFISSNTNNVKFTKI